MMPPPGPAPGMPYQPAGYYSNVPEGRDPRDARDPRELREPRAAYAPMRGERQGFAPDAAPHEVFQASSARRAPEEPFNRPAYDLGRLAHTPGPSSVQEGPPPAVKAPLLVDNSPPRQAYEPAGRGFATFPPPAGTLSNHLNQAGEVHMVDVARKPKTERRAIARGSVEMRADTLARLMGRDAPKGEVLATARVAAVMAAKRTHEIIPLCHAVALTHLDVKIEIDEEASALHVTAVADAYDRTGCEMEAMVAVSTACLTIYDMLKGIDRDIVIGDVKLMEKSGGRSGHFKRSDFKP